MSEQITPNPSVPSQVVAEVTFPKFVNALGIIPTSYKDSMSYYECLSWLCKYLEETVIPTVNQNGSAIEELQGLYIELNSYVTNYFENLDVQEEINNKLDEMATSGVLQDLIDEYFSNVDEQIENFENQVNTQINNQNTQIDTLEGRVDNLSHLEEGSTTGDAELIDGRTSFTGRNFTNIGNNIRKNQRSNCYKDISSTLEVVDTSKYIAWNFGYLLTSVAATNNTIYRFKAKRGVKYYVETQSLYQAPQIIEDYKICYPDYETLINKTTADISNDPITFIGNGGYVYINNNTSPSSFTPKVFEEIENLFDVENYSYIDITESERIEITENSVMLRNGNIAESNNYNVYKFTPKKFHKYKIFSRSSDLAPVIYTSSKMIPNFDDLASGHTYCYTEYELYSLDGEDIYINQLAQSNYAIQEVLILESNFPFSENQDNEYIQNNSIGMTNKAIFCGDSLTYGATWLAETGDNRFYRNFYNYPYFMKKLMNINEIDELAFGGATSETWWSTYNEQITENNAIYFVWLGTNDDYTDTVATDCAGNDYTQFANTAVGYLGKIIGKILSLSNNKVILLNNFATVGTVATNNKVIQDLATKFNAILININTEHVLDRVYHTAYNNYYNRVHFNSSGNNYVANVIFDELNEKIKSNPSLLEMYKVYE